jgi:hypothetical protein
LACASNAAPGASTATCDSGTAKDENTVGSVTRRNHPKPNPAANPETTPATIINAVIYRLTRLPRKQSGVAILKLTALHAEPALTLQREPAPNQSSRFTPVIHHP